MIGDILLIISWVFIITATLGIYRYKNFYNRLLTSSKIDAMSTLLIMSALIIKSGLSGTSFKYLLLLAFLIITNPVSTYLIGNRFYKSRR